MGSVASSVVRSDSLDVKRDAAKFCSVRLYKPSPSHLVRLGESFDCEWPVVPNTTARSGTILWLAPNEWAVVGMDAALVRARIWQCLEDFLFDVNDMGGAYCHYDVNGGESRSFLAKACSLDLHPRVFAAGRCAQTLYAQVGAILVRPDAGSGFKLYVEASLAEYLDAWMVDAAAGYSVSPSMK